MAEESGLAPSKLYGTEYVIYVLVSCCKATLDYLWRKFQEVVGLRLTPVQHIYWKAVQRRMVLSMLKNLIDKTEGGIKGLPPIPYKLVHVLTKSDKAMCAGISDVCYGMEVAPRREEPPHPKQKREKKVKKKEKSGEIALEEIDASESLIEGEEHTDSGKEHTDSREEHAERGEEHTDGGEERTGGRKVHMDGEEGFPDTGLVPRPQMIGRYTRAQTGRFPRELVSDGLEELEQQGSFWSRAIELISFITTMTKNLGHVNVIGQRRADDKPHYRMIVDDGGDGEETDGDDSQDQMDPSELSFFGKEGDSTEATWKTNASPSRHRTMRRSGYRALHEATDQKQQDKKENKSTETEDSTDSVEACEEKEILKVEKEKKERVEAEKKEWRPFLQKINNFIPLRVTNFRYKYMTTKYQIRVKELRDKAARWPLFTWWLSFVQILVFFLSLIIYGVALVGYGAYSERALVQLSDFSVQVVERNITPNFWIGPAQENLVLLGANYGPCMRRDRRLLDAIEGDVIAEASLSGCCVRRDRSGCVQTESEDDCPVTEGFADFVFNDSAVNASYPYTTRAVCGTSPLTCIDPDPARDPRWESENITGWPICTEMHPVTGNGSEHLTCNVTGRPCCLGIQAICLITSQEHCDYIEGTFHPDAFLCAQVDCLSEVCGLLPFAENGVPDQVYRLFLSFFIHAGIIHLMFTLLFNFYVLRDLEKYLGWLSTSLLFLGSGMAGNLVSAIFVPYSPEVGPAAGQFGVIAFFFVFIFYRLNILDNAVLELVKYFGLVMLPLFFIGLFPYVDNFARIGGFVFGVFLGFVVVHYIPDHQSLKEFRRYVYLIDHPDTEYVPPIESNTPIVKYILLATGVIGSVLLCVLAFIWFYAIQETLDGFQYFNCILGLIPGGEPYCQDNGQNIRSRDIL